jgi:hypothetical protein
MAYVLLERDGGQDKAAAKARASASLLLKLRLSRYPLSDPDVFLCVCCAYLESLL